MKLNVGDYVRTKYGITQYKEYETANGAKMLCMPVKDGSNGIFANIEDIIKSSPNIIDLIEVGDYVNGCYVTNKQARHNKGIIMIPKQVGIIKCNAYFNQGNYNDAKFEWIKEEDIKTIVTHEQMEQMKYKVN